jgi:hypothetical protein
MGQQFKTVAELDREGHAPETICTIRQPYIVGRLAHGAFRDVLAYGQSLDLDIEVIPGGSNLVERRGIICAEGVWGDVRKFLVALESLSQT